MSKKPSAGGLVATYCTKCKLDLGHTIMAMVGEKIVRVKCRTCGSEHNYRQVGWAQKTCPPYLTAII